MFTILGVQSILMGLIAEMLVRTYHESQQKPTYIVRKVIEISSGLPASPDAGEDSRDLEAR
jgi:hypothetical protein